MNIASRPRSLTKPRVVPDSTLARPRHSASGPAEDSGSTACQFRVQQNQLLATTAFRGLA